VNAMHIQAAMAMHRQRLQDAECRHAMWVRRRRFRIVIGRRTREGEQLVVGIARGS
jgi:hypothetical protein